MNAVTSPVGINNTRRLDMSLKPIDNNNNNNNSNNNSIILKKLSGIHSNRYYILTLKIRNVYIGWIQMLYIYIYIYSNPRKQF